MFTLPQARINAAGVVLVAHTLTIAAYLLHERAHNTIFGVNRDNARLGELLKWLVGAGYGRYEDIRHKHFRHHVDVVALDFRRIPPRHPRLLKIVQALERWYVPAVDLTMHALVLVLPFRLASRRDRRVRVPAVLTTRIAFFAGLAAISPKALVLHALT